MKKILIACVVIVLLAGISFYVMNSGSSKEPAAPAGISSAAAEQTQPVAETAWTPSKDNPYMLLKNVKFRFTEDIYFNVHNMLSLTEPSKSYEYVNMNDGRSFIINIISAQCSLDPVVMETLFNNYVLNYEGSPLKKLKISMAEMDVDGEKIPTLRISGMMRMGVWLPFEMTSRVGLEKSTNQMTIEALRIKSVGLPFVKNLMDMSGIKLETLLSIKPGRGLSIVKNTMYVDALNLTPPPKLAGTIQDVKVNLKNSSVDLQLGQAKPADVKYTLLVPEAKNYIYIFNGSLIFGKLLSSNGRLQLVDANPSDYFDFYLNKYLLQLSKSDIKMTEDAAMVVNTRDFQSIVKQ